MKCKLPRTLEEFLSLRAVYPFQGITYRLAKPRKNTQRVYCIRNRVEEWVLAWDKGELVRLQKPNVQKLFMDVLKQRFPETPRWPPR